MASRDAGSWVEAKFKAGGDGAEPERLGGNLAGVSVGHSWLGY